MQTWQITGKVWSRSHPDIKVEGALVYEFI